MSDRLLPSGSTQLEVAAAQALSQIGNLSVPLRELWDPDFCPLELLPYLAWAFSVDRWDENWTEPAKRSAVRAAWFVHKHKGTIGALRRVVEPLGYLIRVTEWWQTHDAPGTFRLDVGVLETGITEEMYQELERLITDAKPCSRHLIGLSINLDVTGDFYIAAATYDGEELTVYPYFPETITASGSAFTGSAIHLIDNLRVNYDS
ncbi:phage tail protein I [Rahnella sp. CFA14(1/10)]|uniref:phage tail protein I n=1 Tax=Rahnella sp. CFA14(1/10) TaxID=2511203 RepID=UPI001021A525|nr:phage tail protein I [Rahnella sp. CFA14(1/10)]